MLIATNTVPPCEPVTLLLFHFSLFYNSEH